MRGKVYDCPKCDGNGYNLNSGDRCTMCAGKLKVEDGGPSVDIGAKETRETDYIGGSGYRVVLNLRTHDDN